MSGVIDTIVDVFEAVIAITLTMTLIGPTLAAVSDDFKEWYVEALAPVMSQLGIEDEDVISAQVIDQRLLSDDDVKNLMTKVALDHQSTQRGIIDLLAEYSMKAKGSLDAYFNFGKSHYYNGLPDTNIKAITIPNAVYSVIQAEYGASAVNKISAYVKVPTKEEYLCWKLNKLYGYETWTNELIYTGKRYDLKYMDYNYGTDDYDITIYRDGMQTTEVTVTITPFDATQDTKTTRTYVYVVLLEETVVITDTTINELIPKDSEVGSFTTETVAVEYGTTVISVDAYAPKLNYVVQWYETNNGHIMYWCYEIGSGNTTLDNSQKYITQLDMMPVVEIRNNKINVNSNTASEAYTDGKKILDFIGLDIDALTDSINENPDIGQITNAYVYFGIDLKDTSPVVAKLLYKTFEFIYDQNLVNTTTTTYSAHTTEGNYNATMSWRQQTRTIVSGSIGAVGKYQSEVVGTTLKLRKQETPEQYVEYQIIDIASTTFIHEGGLWATVAKQLKDGGVIMPLNRFIINKLSPLEQLEIFGKSLRLAVYSAEVTHLEWYQTEDFFKLIKVVLIVVTIVLAILSAPIGGSLAGWGLFALKMLAVYAASYAIKKMMEHTSNPVLKALLAIVYVVGSAYVMNGGSFDGLEFLSADTLIGIVTAFNMTLGSITQTGMEKLAEQQNAFNQAYEIAMKNINEAKESIASYLDMQFVTELATFDMNQYIEGVDSMMFRAIGIQYEWDLVKGSRVYENVYDYDKYYRLGIV